jgi:hypothetical protein
MTSPSERASWSVTVGSVTLFDGRDAFAAEVYLADSEHARTTDLLAALFESDQGKPMVALWKKGEKNPSWVISYTDFTRTIHAAARRMGWEGPEKNNHPLK